LAHNFLDGADDDVPEIAGTAFLIPVFELLVGLLDHHDRRINHGPNGDGDAARDMMLAVIFRPYMGMKERITRWDGQNGDDGARDVPQENENNQAHNHQFLDEPCSLASQSTARSGPNGHRW